MRFFVFTLLYSCLHLNLAKAQIANYVYNGGFEEFYTCNGGSTMYLNQVKGWRSLDSNNCCGTYFFNTCLPNIPYSAPRYQWPFKGNSFSMATFFCSFSCTNYPNRGYLRNRLKSRLVKDKTYCVKMYFNLSNVSNVGIDSFGAYFGDNSLDTITKGFGRITYLTPQVQNPSNNFATDTLKWTLLTGTFTANGNEKYMVIGNFKSDVQTNTIVINPTFPYPIGLDMNIDHVSCIDIDLPAFAGKDTSCIPGTSVYIGRQRDVGIDEACMWYKLPITITPTTNAIDTAAGIWVSPTQTSTYVVRQEICGNVKWDTVVVYKDGLGLFPVSSSGVENDIRIFPNPSKEKINFIFKQPLNTVFDVSITNLLGETLFYKNACKLEDELDISFLAPGLYHLKIENKQSKKVFKLLRD